VLPPSSVWFAAESSEPRSSRELKTRSLLPPAAWFTAEPDLRALRLAGRVQGYTELNALFFFPNSPTHSEDTPWLEHLPPVDNTLGVVLEQVGTCCKVEPTRHTLGPTKCECYLTGPQLACNQYGRNREEIKQTPTTTHFPPHHQTWRIPIVEDSERSFVRSSLF
jgi:hypothetical protein